MMNCISNGFEYTNQWQLSYWNDKSKYEYFIFCKSLSLYCRRSCVPFPFTCRSVLCSLLCLPAVCWTSCWHYFSPFHKGVLTAACLCSLYTKCTAERDPFWARGFLKQAICNCSALSTWPEERGQAQIKWIHIRYGPQQRIHSFCRPAVDRITSTHKTFLWVPLMAISISFWCLRKSSLSKSRSIFS